MALLHTQLEGYLELIATGKVRELYALDKERLLFVTTDRISGTHHALLSPLDRSKHDAGYSFRCAREADDDAAYDVIMANGIEGKGAILTRLSGFWLRWLPTQIPRLRTHLITSDLPLSVRQALPAEAVAQLEGRTQVVKRVRVLPIESIVRGYITGSAWTSYQSSGTVCDIPLPPGLRESEKLSKPLWTPSTKAEAGANDENISPQRGRSTPISHLLTVAQRSR